MSRVTYDAGTMTVTVDGLETVEQALGDLKRKTPAAAKVAINAAAREARKLMIARAKARYAVNAAGRRHLNNLKQTKRATNNRLEATLSVKSLERDLGYFRTHKPYPTHYTGTDWVKGPSVWTGKVLKSSSMKPLEGDEHNSKAFLVKFKSGHIGMVQRVLGSNSENTMTENGRPRWRTADGRVETLQTMGAPSETAMHGKVWPEAEPDIEMFLLERLNAQVQKVLARAGRER